MQIRRLRLRDVRRFKEQELQPAPGFNLIVGDNGSGKSSLLEAMHLMAHGRSFRGRVRDGLIRQGEAALEVYLEWQQAAGQHRAGLRHTGSKWEARLDGANVNHLGELCAALAVVSFEPGSHILIHGSSEARRRYLDWGLFHVEQDFLPQWRRYARALKQRNALLRFPRADSQLDAWEHELAQSGEQLSAYRDAYVGRLQPHLDRVVAALFPTAGSVVLSLQPGWKAQELALVDALLLSRERDQGQGHTTIGPHRADLRLEFGHLPGRESLSRGQAKLAALSLLIAQAAHLAEHDGVWPVLQLDDLASELDRHHQQRVLQYLHGCGAQVFVTGTEPPAGLSDLGIDVTMFHVEHGVLRASA
ncbi:DNA replication/repair protein RecF [Thermomonas sp.]|uniref:DNA replication/repair protein RecF n=1 Tax=Thermomonas sp. TaxID=1971895 RepID=UPI0024878983|nr:DNA replication/repair protein RecF [Thermomonas sp.]MDI1252265.1 DNA replication/repair protein RecF [Thermomonas sp.]